MSASLCFRLCALVRLWRGPLLIVRTLRVVGPRHLPPDSFGQGNWCLHVMYPFQLHHDMTGVFAGVPSRTR